MTQSEEWRPVVGFEGLYEVSDRGRVRGVPRWDALGRAVPGRIRRQGFDRYWFIMLNKDGALFTRRVHRMVLEAFVGPCPDGMESCHTSGDPNDNRLANLRWDTHAANQQDTLRYGNNGFAKKTHCRSGHEYTPDNTQWIKNTRRRNPYRVCVTCRRAYDKRRNEVKKEKKP